MSALSGYLPTGWKQSLTSWIPHINSTQVKALFIIFLQASAGIHATPVKPIPQRPVLPKTPSSNPTTAEIDKVAQNTLAKEEAHFPMLRNNLYTPPSLQKTDFRILLAELPFSLQTLISDTDSFPILFNLMRTVIQTVNVNPNAKFNSPEVNANLIELENRGLSQFQTFEIIKLLVAKYDSNIDISETHVDLQQQRLLVIYRLLNNVCDLPFKEIYKANLDTLAEYFYLGGSTLEPDLNWNHERGGGAQLLNSLKKSQDYAAFSEAIIGTLFRQLEINNEINPASTKMRKSLSGYKAGFNSLLNWMETTPKTPLHSQHFVQTILSVVDGFLGMANEYIDIFKKSNNKAIVNDINHQKSLMKKIARTIFAEAYRRCDNPKESRDIIQSDIYKYSEKIRTFFSEFERLEVTVKHLKKSVKLRKNPSPHTSNNPQSEKASQKFSENQSTMEIYPEVYLAGLFMICGVFLIFANSLEKHLNKASPKKKSANDENIIEEHLKPSSFKNKANIETVNTLLVNLKNDIKVGIHSHYDNSFESFVNTLYETSYGKYLPTLMSENFYDILEPYAPNLTTCIRNFCASVLIHPIDKNIHNAVSKLSLKDRAETVAEIKNKLKNDKKCSQTLNSTLFATYLESQSLTLDSFIESRVSSRFPTPSSSTNNPNAPSSPSDSKSLTISIPPQPDTATVATETSSLSTQKTIESIVFKIVESNLNADVKTLSCLVADKLNENEDTKKFLNDQNGLKELILNQFTLLVTNTIASIIKDRKNVALNKLFLHVEKRLEQKHSKLNQSPLFVDIITYKKTSRDLFIDSIMKDLHKGKSE